MTAYADAIGAVLVGVVGRAGLVYAAGLALAAPALAAALGARWVGERRRRATRRIAAGLEYRLGAYYATNHTWLAPRDTGDLVVGIDDLARRLLPSATAVDLPRAGAVVRKGDPVAVIRAGRRAVEISAPVDGRVVEANRRVRRNPALVRDAAYDAGWLFSLAPADGGYMRLPQGEEAAGWMQSERTRLDRFMEHALGIAAADGGELLSPAPALLGEEGWKRACAAFLR